MRSLPGANASIMKRSGLVIDDLRTVMEAAARTSKLGRWFVANQVGFAMLLKTHRPRWEALAVKFAEEGLISVPPAFWGDVDTPERSLARKRAGEAARQVWHRVKGKPVRVSPPAPQAPVRGPQPDPAAFRDSVSHEAGEDEFRPARLRSR